MQNVFVYNFSALSNDEAGSPLGPQDIPISMLIIMYLRGTTTYIVRVVGVAFNGSTRGDGDEADTNLHNKYTPAEQIPMLCVVAPQ